MPRVFRTLVAAMLVLPLLFAVVSAPAMAGSTQTGTIRGKVVDDKGQAVPGATILLRSPALIRERATVTDADGSYFAAGLPPGQYQVLAQMTGFQTVAAITEVQLDKTTNVPLTMKEGELTETVTVTSTKPVVNKTQTDTAKVIDKKQTDNLPVGRSYQSLIQFAPGVTGGSNPNMLGGTSNSNVYLADGVSVRDPVTGTFGANMIFDAIEAVDVKLTGVSAEYGGFQGGLTNMITKSGGNSFTGSLRDVVSQPNWTRQYSQATKGSFQPVNAAVGYIGKNGPPSIPARGSDDTKTSNRIQTTLGGPIVTDRAWFFLGYDKNKVTGLGLTRSNQTYPTNFDGDYALGKATWQVTNNHRLQYFYSRDPALTTRDYATLFFGGPYDASSIDVQTQGGTLWVANWNGIWGPSLVSDVKVARFQNSFGIADLAEPHYVTGGDANTRGLTTGSGGAAPGYELSTGIIYDSHIFSSDPDVRKREQYEGAVTYFLDTKSLGTHTLKVGLDYSKQTNAGSSAIKGNALFYFYTLVGDPTFAACNSSEGANGDPFNLACRYYAQWTDYQAPTQAGPTNKMKVAYVQDDWQLNQRLAFNLGLRYEKNDNLNDVGEHVISASHFSPRLGASFDVTGAGKHVIKGTFAQYKNAINLTTLSSFVRAAGGQSAYTVWANSGAPGQNPVWEKLYSVAPTPETAGFAPNIKPQSINEWTLGYEFSPSPNYGFGLRYVNRSWNDIVGVHYAYEYPVDNGFVLPTKITEIANNPDAKRDYTAWILTADKRFSNNWSVSANYVRSEAKGNVTTDDGFPTLGSYPGNPKTTENQNGLLPWDTKDQAKVQAYYQLPLKSERHNISIGAVFNLASGLVYAKGRTDYVVVGPGADGVLDLPLGTEVTSSYGNDQKDRVAFLYEARGSRRTPTTKQLDLSFNYRYVLTQKMNFEFRTDIFNVTNEQEIIGVQTSWYANANSTSKARANYLFGHPQAYTQLQTPVGYRFQFALTW